MELDFKKKIIIGAFISIVVLILGYLYYDYINNSNTASIEIEENTNESNKNIVEKNLEKNETQDEQIIVHIAGAVNKPGIVKIKEGARLYEAIENAGGCIEEADLSKVNLAYKISDGQKIYIPKIGEIINEQYDQTGYIYSDFGNNGLIEDGNGITNGGEKVNINTANQAELETLPGIGPATAQKIIEYRNTNGKFQAIEDIQNVKGIGDGKFEEIKDNIIV